MIKHLLKKSLPFSVLVGALYLGTSMVGSLVMAETSSDQIFTNAIIYGHYESDSIAIKNGKIIFIGQKQNALEYANTDTNIIDLQQRFVLPGFIDNHNHVFEAASELGGNCELEAEATLEEQIPYLEA